MNVQTIVIHKLPDLQYVTHDEFTYKSTMSVSLEFLCFDQGNVLTLLACKKSMERQAVCYRALSC